MPPFPAARTHRAALALVVAIAAAQPAFGGPPDCSCQTLGSLQQEYRNAMTLTDYFQRLAEYLKGVEVDQRRLFPNDPERVDDHLGSATFRYKEKHPPTQGLISVEGAGGPKLVDLIHGTCAQEPLELAQMADAAPCRAVADATLGHEAFHRAKCRDMGPEAYWNQSQVEIALEEVAAYTAQAGALKAEIRRVLESAEVIYSADSRFDLDVQGMAQYGYLSSARSEDIGQATGGDTWTMTGRGTSTGGFTKFVVVGMQCTASGAVNSSYAVMLTTDGLNFDLEIGDISTSGALSVICGGGRGGSGPFSELTPGPGQITSEQPLNAGDNPLPSDMTDEVRALLSSVGTVVFEGKSFLSVTCPAP